MAYATENRDWNEYYHPPLETEEEVLTVYEEQFPFHDFWEDHFNLAILQQILDMKFNCSPSSEYVAVQDVSQTCNQLKVKCKVCNCDLGGYAIVTSHNDGKRHKKMAQMNVKRLMDPGLEFEFELKDLGQRMNIFQPGTLEHDIDNDQQPIVGAQYLYTQTQNANRTYHCKLCKFHTHTKETMLAHLKAIYHIQSFFSEVHAACAKVVSNEGQINHAIPDFCIPTNLQGCVNKEAKKYAKYLKVERNALLPMTREIGTQKAFDPKICITLVKKLAMIFRTTERLDLSKSAFFLSCIFLSLKKLDNYYKEERDHFKTEKMKKLFNYFENICKDMHLVHDGRALGW
ncbi:uncharacterized protein LOC122247431 isoform X2 [Penaeus japonicus]|uniref:uncharacterized protein LOC122247431 isoform X2 n=1 Tax=Penaeus japonicus TaxID=27405 RepID=UPI001C7145E1|nr:uncharacterized protein LOC122247431 isoform X2 [Penaeus japonicus]